MHINIKSAVTACRLGRKFSLHILFYFWLTLVAIGFCIWFWPSTSCTPLIEKNGWEPTTGFFPNGESAQGDLPDSIRTSGALTLWRSWSPATNAAKGRLATSPFYSKTKSIGIPIAGYPTAPGISVYIENLETKEKHRISYGDAHEQWQLYIYELPKNWRSRAIRIMAESSSTNSYVGVGTPFEVPSAFSSLISLPGICFIHLSCALTAWFFATPLACLLNRVYRIKKILAITLALPASGFAIFFLFFLVPPLAKCLCALTLLFGAYLNIRSLIHTLKSPAHKIKRNISIALWFSISLAATLLLYSQQTTSLAYSANYRFTPASWSTDNQIPSKIGALLEQGRLLKDWDFGEWQISDRPPLMGGAMALPAWLANIIWESNDNLSALPFIFNTFGICLLALWIFPIWEWLRLRKTRTTLRILSLIVLSASPFLFFNMVYIWPKLLSATLALLGWLLIASPGLCRSRSAEAILAGIAIGLSLMSHGGAFFGLSAMAMVLLATQSTSRWKYYILAGLCSLVIITPWIAWVKSYAPPGNALTKLAFAGSTGISDPSKSVTSTIIEAYRNETLAHWIHKKEQAVRSLAGLHQPISQHTMWPQEGNRVRFFQFFHIIPSIGILLLCLPTVALSPKKTIHTWGTKPSTVLLVSLVGIALQILIMWDHHVVHHYSYSTLLLLHFFLVMCLLQSPTQYIRFVAIATMTFFGYFWIIDPIISFNKLSLTISGAVALIYALGLYFVARADINGRHDQKARPVTHR